MQHRLTHSGKRVSRKTSRRKGRGVGGNGYITPRLMYSEIFQPVLDISTASNIKEF